MKNILNLTFLPFTAAFSFHRFVNPISSSATNFRRFTTSSRFSVRQFSRIFPIAATSAFLLLSSSSLTHSIATAKLASSNRSMSTQELEIDPEYPGTAVQRMRAVRERVRSLPPEALNSDWEAVRRNILWAGGLRDLTNVAPGMGYTGHSFNDFNHCDLTTMLDGVSFNENRGNVPGIAYGNQLGPGIRTASLPELGPGGSWSTCIIGNNYSPPRDVAHVQFRSRIAFKLVWVPPEFTTFVLVDDDGHLLAKGTPNGARLPDISERMQNYRTVVGGKYAIEADKIAATNSRAL